MSPVVSRAAADAYNVLPGVREALPPEVLRDMETLDEFLTALAAVDETYPGRLMAEGDPMGWPGLGEAGVRSRFVETGGGLLVEEG